MSDGAIDGVAGDRLGLSRRLRWTINRKGNRREMTWKRDFNAGGAAAGWSAN
jgi:hypothetical protein